MPAACFVTVELQLHQLFWMMLSHIAFYLSIWQPTKCLGKWSQSHSFVIWQCRLPSIFQWKSWKIKWPDVSLKGTLSHSLSSLHSRPLEVFFLLQKKHTGKTAEKWFTPHTHRHTHTCQKRSCYFGGFLLPSFWDSFKMRLPKFKNTDITQHIGCFKCWLCS